MATPLAEFAIVRVPVTIRSVAALRLRFMNERRANDRFSSPLALPFLPDLTWSPSNTSNAFSFTLDPSFSVLRACVLLSVLFFLLVSLGCALTIGLSLSSPVRSLSSFFCRVLPPCSSSYYFPFVLYSFGLLCRGRHEILDSVRAYVRRDV